jgi:hypothetical protein
MSSIKKGKKTIFSIEIFSFVIEKKIFPHENIKENPEHSKVSTIFLLKKVYASYFKSKNSFEKISSNPYPFFVSDEIHGYKINPGIYTFTYTKKKKGFNHYFKNIVTVDKNSQRFIGKSNSNPVSNIYVFGDSFVFGEGVNDEQTFTFLLQNKFPQYKFHLLAAGGYSLTNAYMNFEKMKSKIKPNDLIILGYADYMKERHVASPSRLKSYGHPSSIIKNPHIKHLRAYLDKDNELAFTYVPIFCEFSGEYCNSPDPDNETMNKITEKIITKISEEASCKVIVLHFSGSKQDPVIKKLRSNVKILEATDEDFDYDIRDDIMGFDPHPGPFWHYAMFKKITDNMPNFSH